MQFVLGVTALKCSFVEHGQGFSSISMNTNLQNPLQNFALRIEQCLGKRFVNEIDIPTCGRMALLPFICSIC
jgi:hypothetical protein